MSQEPILVQVPMNSVASVFCSAICCISIRSLISNVLFGILGMLLPYQRSTTAGETKSLTPLRAPLFFQSAAADLNENFNVLQR